MHDYGGLPVEKYPAADAYLRRYFDAQRESKYLEEHIEYLREQATSLQRRLDGMPRGSAGHDKMATVVSGVLDEEAAIVEKIAQVHDIRREVTRCIDCIPVERTRRVMFMYYVQGLTVLDIQDRIDRGKSSVVRVRQLGLAYIEEHCAEVLRAAGFTVGSGSDGAPVDFC